MIRYTVLAVAFSLLISVGGCSSGRYDADYARAIDAYREAAPFGILGQTPASLTSKVAAVSLRLPEGFVAVEDGPPAQDGGPQTEPDPTRLRPPFLSDLPGYRGTFERRVSANGTELPLSVAVAVRPAGGLERGEIEAAILRQVRADEAFADAEVAWADRTVKPSAGGPAAWRVLSLQGPQIFESTVAGNVEYKRWDGRCDIWLSAEPDEAVRTTLVWRLPQLAEGALPLPPDRLAEVVARTVAAEAVEPPLEEDVPPAAEDAGL